MEKEMEKEKNIIQMVKSNVMGNIQRENYGMGKEKNIIMKVYYYPKLNIKMGKQFPNDLVII